MKNKFLFLSLILLTSFKLFAQNPAMIFAPKYKNLVTGGIPIPLPAPGSSGNEHYAGAPANYTQNIQLNYMLKSM